MTWCDRPTYPPTSDGWERATFAGTERAQAELAARLTPDARLELLEQLLEVAEASGALRQARDDTQQSIDRRWGVVSTKPIPKGHATGTRGRPTPA